MFTFLREIPTDHAPNLHQNGHPRTTLIVPLEVTQSEPCVYFKHHKVNFDLILKKLKPEVLH